ncbi:MAG: hypothetical protein ACYTGL_07550 [Planctomycetota bacterium]|jgi:hypothetical protein
MPFDDAEIPVLFERSTQLLTQQRVEFAPSGARQREATADRAEGLSCDQSGRTEAFDQSREAVAIRSG